jgi:hypothetical protein
MSNEHDTLENELTVHVFTVASAMVGVCLTGIGLFRAFNAGASGGGISDDLLAVDATLFALVSILAFFSLRTRSPRARRRLRAIADPLFLVALTLMVVVCVILTYDVA